MVKPIPDGYHTLTPYLIVNGAAKALEFYAKAFDARELFRMPHGDRIGHAEMQIGSSRFMLADESPESHAFAPSGDGRVPVSFLIYTDDCDKLFARAVEAGAKVMRPLSNQFYGDRLGMLMDPFGHTWSIATHIEDVSPEEMNRRMSEHH